MKQPVPPNNTKAQDVRSATHAAQHQIPSAGAPSGHLAQLAAMANQSPQVQAQLKLAEDLRNSPQVESQRSLAAEINAAPAAQLVRLDDKRPTAQGKLDEKKLQGKFNSSAAPAQLEQSHQPNRTGLPDQLKTGVESLSGVSLDSVKVHYNSAKPAQLNALAYAQGSDIHVGPGQEKHLPHEAWHVAQQSQGRVQPTMQTKGVAINDDSGLEHEADVMGAKAATVQAKAETTQAMDKRKKK
jgi:hypothetical protein